MPVIGDEIFLLRTERRLDVLRTTGSGLRQRRAVPIQPYSGLKREPTSLKIKLGATDIEGRLARQQRHYQGHDKGDLRYGLEVQRGEDNCKLDLRAENIHSFSTARRICLLWRIPPMPMTSPSTVRIHGIFLLGFDGWTSGDDNEMKNDAKYTGTYRKELQSRRAFMSSRSSAGDTTSTAPKRLVRL